MATQRTQIYFEGVALDLDKNVDIDFTYSITDIADFERRSTTFSKTIYIPGTGHNNFLLGTYFDLNISNPFDPLENNIGVNFNPLKKAFAKVTLDNIEIFVGVLRILEIKFINGELIYECALFGSLTGLFSALGEQLLTNLDLDDLTHIYNITNIKATWDDPTAKYVYPLSMYGLGTSLEDDTYSVFNFRPAIKVKEVFDRIITQNGYTYNDTLFDVNNLDKLIILNNEETLTSYGGLIADITFDYNIFNFTDPFDPTTSSFYFNTAIASGVLAIDEITGGFHRIKNISAGNQTITFNLTFDCSTTLNAGESISICASQRNDASIYTEIALYENPVFIPGVATFNSSFTVTLAPNDGLNFLAKTNAYSPPIFMIEFFDTSRLSVGGIDDTKKTNLIYDSEITGRSLVPEGVRQSDFIKSIINMLNLYIETDPQNEFDLRFTPYPEFYSDTVIDWTSKMSLRDGVLIKPPSEFLPLKYSFNYKNDVDYYSKFYLAKYAINYGNYSYPTGTEFSREDNATELILSLCPLIKNEFNNRVYSAMFDLNQDGTYKQVRTNPKIAFYGGVKDTSSYTINNGETVLTTETEYPYAGHILDLDSPSDGSLWDLVFAAPNEIYFTQAVYPVENLFQQYYLDFMSSKTNKDAKLVTLYLLLNTVDIMNLDFKDIIRIQNGIYYLNKIDGYNPLSDSLTKVELIKIP
tara:strand:+ start:2669 stop:4756 length:2088 start_codon:yes stop_codon:yes gene_type:complete